MNQRRLAQLFRQRSELDREIAEAFEEDEAAGALPAAPPAKKSTRRRRGPASVSMPEDVTDLDIARARRTARRIGIRVEG